MSYIILSNSPEPGAIATGKVCLYVGSDGRHYIKSSTGVVTALMPPEESGLNFIIGTGVSVISTGVRGHFLIPFNCRIEQATILALVSGSIVLDLWRDTYANFPPTAADSICGTSKPTLVSTNRSQDSTLSGWSTNLVRGDILAVNVDSASTVTQVTLALLLRRT